MAEPLAGPPAAERTCIECGGPMERGFLADKTDSGASRPFWVEGVPVRSFWTGVKTGGRDQYHVETFRCAHCGALRAYATEFRQ